MTYHAGNSDFDLFALSDEHEELRAVLRTLCEKEIAPHAADVDEHARFPDQARSRRWPPTANTETSTTVKGLPLAISSGMSCPGRMPSSIC